MVYSSEEEITLAEARQLMYGAKKIKLWEEDDAKFENDVLHAWYWYGHSRWDEAIDFSDEGVKTTEPTRIFKEGNKLWFLGYKNSCTGDSWFHIELL